MGGWLVARLFIRIAGFTRMSWKPGKMIFFNFTGFETLETLV
jgi:hypothetical protein